MNSPSASAAVIASRVSKDKIPVVRSKSLHRRAAGLHCAGALAVAMVVLGLAPAGSGQGAQQAAPTGETKTTLRTPAKATPNLEATPSSPASAVPSTTPAACRTVQEAVSSPEVVQCIHSAADTELTHAVRMNSVIERGDNVTVPILGLKGWANDKAHKDHDPHALRLFLAGHLLPKDEPSLIELEQGYVNFQLTSLSGTSDIDERRAWLQIFTEARRQKGGRVPISVGLPKDLQPFASELFISVRVYPSYTPYVAVGLVLLLIALVVLGWQSDLLRDTSRGRPPGNAKAPYSLGRMQMAWWFYLVVAAYAYIALITKEVNSLTATALTLIGISAGTGLASVFVNKQKQTDQASQKVALESEKPVVQARITELEQANPRAGSAESFELHDRRKRLQEITALLGKIPTTQVAPAGKGISDVLKDGEGLSFHRFQIAVWTVVLGLVFIRSVLQQLVMPDFDTTLLGLMGISSGTYIGFKFPEKS